MVVAAVPAVAGGSAIGAAGVTAGAAILGTGLSMHASRSASRRQYQYQKALVGRQRRFQRRMANTAHRREVKDLRAAGLNPILSATGGPGAPSPSSASGSVGQSVVPDISSSAMAGMRLRAEIENLESLTDLNKSKTGIIRPAGDVGDLISDVVTSSIPSTAKDVWEFMLKGASNLDPEQRAARHKAMGTQQSESKIGFKKSNSPITIRGGRYKQ